jgi:hypothetical protein
MSNHRPTHYGLREIAGRVQLSLMKDLGIQVVQVRTDDFPRGEVQLWLAAVPRQSAVNAVLMAVPEGWTVRLAEPRLRRSEAEVLQLPLGMVRKFRD